MEDNRKKYNSSWENLKKGPIAASKIAKENAIHKSCLNCGNEFKVYSSTFSRKKFCSQTCKNEGQSKGLTKPMRAGTGMSYTRKVLSKKYDRYRKKDGGIDLSRDEFYAMIENGSCHYCGSCESETLGLDRIDNNMGHTKENTLIACELCNTTRGHRFTVNQMMELGKLIHTFDMNGWRVMGKKQLDKLMNNENWKNSNIPLNK